MPDENRSAPPISVQLAITQLLVIGLTALAVRLQIDSKTTSDNVYALSSLLTAIIIAAFNGLQTHLATQRAKKTETLAPGLGKLQVPEGKEVIVTTAINDPNTPDPPTVISETTTKSSDIPEVRPMKAIKLLLFSMVGMIVMICGLSGCSNMTPNQRVHAGVVGYITADVALTAADAAGKLPAAAKPTIQADMGNFAQRLRDAQAWVEANPTLADTPGVSPPSLDALDVVRAIVRKYVLKYALFAPLPAPAIPTTQPVLIPIPG
jgi:hypothetical protein